MPEEKVPVNYEYERNKVLESIRDKAESFENKELTNEEKAKIIAQRDARQKKKLEELKKAQRKAELKEESERQNQQRIQKSLNSEKAEELRNAQMKQARKSQAQLLNSTNKRTQGSVSLKGGKNVRSKVSQNSVKKKQQLKNNFTDQED